jgi:hypothetical protein
MSGAGPDKHDGYASERVSMGLPVAREERTRGFRSAPPRGRASITCAPG